VQRLWSANDIKPHLVRTYKLSNDPPVRSQVLGRDRPVIWTRRTGRWCCAATRRANAKLSSAPSRDCRGRRPYPHQRPSTTPAGTVTLFAALSYLDGKIFAQTAPRHTHQQWLAFLKHLDKQGARHPGAAT